MSDMDPAGRSLPDIGNLTLASLASDSAVTAAEFREMIFHPDLPDRTAAFNSEIGGDSHIVHPDVPERMAAFQSEIGGDECLVPSTNSS
ncbi:hypothetical protein ACGFYQ_19525 [Streptomyces sp. NPDC048258]|uniref:hypothetical protein n=1 Tax=Streptomyces sp. NPDC048258 TaxID=3365527 RepID=UPI00371EFC6D